MSERIIPVANFAGTKNSKPKVDKRMHPMSRIFKFRTRLETTKQYWEYSDLPPHLVVDIFSFLPYHDLISAGKVCRSWRKSFKHPTLWIERGNDMLGKLFDLKMEEYILSPHGRNLDIPKKSMIKGFDLKNFEVFCSARHEFLDLLGRKESRIRDETSRRKNQTVLRKMKKVNLLTYVIYTIAFYALFSFYCYFIGIRYFLLQLFKQNNIVFMFPLVMLSLICVSILGIYVHFVVNIIVKNCWPWKNRCSAVAKIVCSAVVVFTFVFALLASFLCLSYFFHFLGWYLVVIPAALSAFTIFVTIQVYHIRYIRRNSFTFNTKKIVWHAAFEIAVLLMNACYSLFLASCWIPLEFVVVREAAGIDWYFFLPVTFMADAVIVAVLLSAKWFLELRWMNYLVLANYGLGVLGWSVMKILLIFFGVVGHWSFFCMLAPITCFASSTLYLVLTKYYR